MTQLTELMINRFHVFGGAPRPSDRVNVHVDTTERLQGSHSRLEAPDRALEQYFKAADEILVVINRSCKDHYRYVNPFLANTIWLAAAVQLVHKESTPSGNKDFKQSDFEVLHIVYKSFVGFWNMSTILQQNLARLELQLKQFRRNSQDSGDNDRYSVSQASIIAENGVDSIVWFNVNGINGRESVKESTIAKSMLS
jgi:hypothetical protein